MLRPPSVLSPFATAPALLSPGRRYTPPQRALPLFHRSYGLMRQSHPPLLSFGLTSFEKSLQVVSSPCCEWDLPALSLRILPGMLGPLPRRYRMVHLPVSSPASSAFPESRTGRLPAWPRQRFPAGEHFGAADISLCSGLPVCWPPDRSYRCAYSLRAAGAFTSEQNMLRCLRMHRIC